MFRSYEHEEESQSRLVHFYPGIFPSSWLSYVLRGAPVGAISPDLLYRVTPTEQPVSVKLLGIDIGNDAIKISVLDDQRRFVTVRLPATYQVAPKLRAGSGPTTWQIEGDPEAFWIDTPEGESLPVGPTWQRLSDRRYRRFIYAAIIEALLAAGYRPGAYKLVLGIGVRNEEIERDPDTDKERLDPDTQRELVATLRTAPFVVKQGTAPGAPRWTIDVVRLAPAAQTFGTFFSWFYDLGGNPVESPIRQVSILDYGGGDTHLLHVDVRPNRRHIITGEWVGNGTVDIATAFASEVRSRFSLSLSVAEAQAALVHGTIVRDGRDVSIADVLAPIKQSRIEEMLGRAMPVLRNGKRYILHTGGGAALIADEIHERMAQLGRQSQSYLVLPTEVASLANVVGLYAQAYYRILTTPPASLDARGERR